jgi:hypothetical protein
VVENFEQKWEFHSCIRDWFKIKLTQQHVITYKRIVVFLTDLSVLFQKPFVFYTFQIRIFRFVIFIQKLIRYWIWTSYRRLNRTVDSIWRENWIQRFANTSQLLELWRNKFKNITEMSCTCNIITMTLLIFIVICDLYTSCSRPYFPLIFQLWNTMVLQ